MGSELGGVLNTAVLESSMTVTEIEEYMRQLHQNKRTPCYFTISGFENDKRDLWVIPEAVELMKRAWDVGFVSVLHGNVPDHPDYLAGFFGALQLWVCINGIANQPFTEDLHRKFVREYTAACVRGNRVCEGGDGNNRLTNRIFPRR